MSEKLIPKEDAEKILRSKDFFNSKIKEIFERISDDELIAASAVSVLSSIACAFIFIVAETLGEDENTISSIFLK